MKFPKLNFHKVLPALFSCAHLFSDFLSFLFSYLRQKVLVSSFVFEQNKNVLVRFFMMKRGRYNRPFLHITAMVVMVLGIFIAPFLAETYPVFSSQGTLSGKISTQAQAQQSIVVGENVFGTEISQKPRDSIIMYTVQNGDTLSTIAQKFQISTDTVKWANDLSADSITVGDTLKILPVSGISHKVAAGETVNTIAKKYDTEAQKIADFPFNDFANPEKFTLVEGQMLIVPDGIKPSEQPFIKRQVFIAQGPVTQVSGGGFTWPLQGPVSQFASWYHMALDILSPIGTPIAAAQNGTVTYVSVGAWEGGYGTHVIIDNGAGLSSLYAHMSGVNVSVGQQVTAGRSVIGWVGMTGRTTGPHVHFEIRQGGSLVNPMSYLQ